MIHATIKVSLSFSGSHRLLIQTRLHDSATLSRGAQADFEGLPMIEARQNLSGCRTTVF
jgi:hypothetical protein